MTATQLFLDVDAQDGTGHFPAFGFTYLYPTVQVTDPTDGITITKTPNTQQYGGSLISYQLYATDNANMSPANWAWNLDFSQNPFVPGAPSPITFFAPAGPCSFTVNSASPAVVTWTATAAFTQAFPTGVLPNGTQVQLTSLTGGAGLTQGNLYYVVNSGNGTFNLSATLNGTPVNTSGSGSGTFTVTRYRYSGLVPVTAAAALTPYETIPAQAVTQTIYVTTSGNDYANGLTWATAKATIAGALAALGSNAGVIQLGSGTFTISQADGHGNGVTLANTSQIIQGISPVSTTVNINTTVTWGIQALAAGCKVRNLAVTCGASGVVTYACGVDTATSGGSAELCVFENVNVTAGSGTMTNGFAVGPTWTGTNTPDIAETYFLHCRSILVSNAAYYVGEGTVSQILNTFFIGCYGGRANYGLYVNSTNVTWLGGTLQKNAYDVYFAGPVSAAASRIVGVRSENSQRLLGCDTNSTGVGNLTIQDFTWASPGGFQAGYPAAAGDFIQWGHCGTLNLINVSVTTGLSSPNNETPVISITVPNSTHQALALNINGYQAATTLANLVSSTNTQVVASVTGFVPLEATTNAPPASTAPATPATLVYNSATATINGTTYTPMVQRALVSAAPYATVTLGAPAANITFSAIPAGFSTLRLVVVGASAVVAELDRWGVTVNGDNGANYDSLLTTGTNASTVSGPRSAAIEWLTNQSTGELPGASATANSAGILEVTIPNYAGTTFNKIGFWKSGYIDAATAAADQDHDVGVVQWRSTAAITSIRVIAATTSNLVAGTTAYLYLS